MSYLKSLGTGLNTYDVLNPDNLAEFLGEKADAILKSVTGDNIIIEDAAESPVKSLSVNIKPVQNLNGYNYPWVGGNGKNICYIEDFTETLNGVTFTAANNVLTLNGTCTSGIGEQNAIWKHIRFDIANEGSYARSYTCTGEFPETIIWRSFSISGDTSYKPAVSTYPAGQYYIGTYIGNGDTFDNYQISFQIEAGSVVTSFEPYKNICPISGQTQAVVTRTNDGSDTQTVTFQFGQTVYGGLLNVLTGNMVIDRVIFTLPAVTKVNSATQFTTKYVNYTLPSNANNAALPICDRTKCVLFSQRGQPYNLYVSPSNPALLQSFVPADATVESVNAALEGAMVVYYLASPITVTLTPQQMTMLLGFNHIFVNCGDVTIEYLADTKLYVDEAVDAVKPKVVTISGSTPTINAVDGTRYVCGECSTLDIVLPSSGGIIDVIFTSGSTPTVLTVTAPTGVTLKWANDFDPTSLDVNITYEINIMNGLGVVCSWT